METIDSFEGEFRFLSNFYPSRIKFEDAVYESVEHAFQAAKTLDKAERAEVRAAPSPGKAKRLGRKVTLREDWEKVKVPIMWKLVEKKFLAPELAEKLVATGDAELIEGNIWRDTFWGVCDGVGKNNLGLILMAVRTDIRCASTLYRIVLFGRPMKGEDGFKTEEAAEARAGQLGLNSWEYETEPYVGDE